MTVDAPAPELDPVLQSWVSNAIGSVITSVAPIGRGASRRIWRVDLADGNVVVVREDTGAGPVTGTPLDLEREATVYAALFGSGLPIPRLYSRSPDGRAILLDHRPGSERFDSLTAKQRTAVARDYGRWLAKLHQLDVAALPVRSLGEPADGPAHAVDDLVLWADIQRTRTGEFATPSAPVALRALARQAPAVAVRTSLCHGDAGPGNFLHDGRRVTALLDWEFAHIGDPHDDLAWVAVRNQVLRHPLDLADVYRAWQRESGLIIDSVTLEYYRAVVLARMLVSCDATICWSGGEDAAPLVQVMLRPFLDVALLEALRRAGIDAPEAADLAEPARERWAASPIADLLGDPASLDDLGAAR